MRLSTTAVLVCAAIARAGCAGDNAPASPPAPTEPLTTSSPTTVDTDMATVTATAQPPADPVETTAAVDGPPEMPDEAREDSEAGAEAFALHYIDLINYTGMYPEVGLLEPLATDDCATCDNFEATVVYSAEAEETLAEPMFEVRNVVVLHAPSDGTAQARVEAVQVEQAIRGADGSEVDRLPGDEGVWILDLLWDESWYVSAMNVQ